MPNGQDPPVLPMPTSMPPGPTLPPGGTPGKPSMTMPERLAKLGEVLGLFGAGIGQMQGGPSGPPVAIPGVQGGSPPQVAMPAPTAPGMPPQSPFPAAAPRSPTPAPASSGFAFGSKRAARAATVHDAIQGFVGLANELEEKKYNKEKNKYEYMIKMYFDAMENYRATGDPKHLQFASDLAESKEFQKVVKDIGGYSPLPPEKPPAAVSALNDVVSKQNAAPGAGMPTPQGAPASGTPQPPAYSGAPKQPGGMPTSMPVPAGPTQDRVKEAAQNVIGAAPQALQAPLAAWWSAASMFPNGAAPALAAMSKATTDFVSNQQEYGNKIALEQFKESWGLQKELLKEENVRFLADARDKVNQAMLDKRLGAQADMLHDRLDSMESMNDKRIAAQDRRTQAYLDGVMAKINATGGKIPLTIASRVTQAEIIKEQVSDLRLQLQNKALTQYMGPIVGQTGFITRRLDSTVQNFFASQESLDALLPILHGYRGGSQMHATFKKGMGSLDMDPKAYGGTLDALDKMADNIINEVRTEYPDSPIWKAKDKAAGTPGPAPAHSTTTSNDEPLGPAKDLMPPPKR